MGGGVRDLLLGREPKDFDIATDAHPDEVQELFRNCRLIGRRFRLAHVRFGREIVEVATFRGSHGDEGEGDGHIVDGRIVRDNVYGTLEEDAWRRDFTVNSLYYTVKDFSVVDFTGGVEDLNAGVMRVIGDPDVRYREDPVRMLRAIRFAAKLGFRIHSGSEAQIVELASLLETVPPARLFDEVLKLFLGGTGLAVFELMRHYDAFRYLFPDTDASLSEEEEGFPKMMVAHAMANADARIAEDKPVTPAFLFAALLWDPMKRIARDYQQQGMNELQAIEAAGAEVVARQAERVTLPRRFSSVTREIWALQPRLERRSGRRPMQLLANRRFRAAYDFLLLRAQAGEDVKELADWWTEFQQGDDAQRETAARQAPARKRPRRRRKKPEVS